MKMFICILLLSTNLYAGNWGHRASGGKGEYHDYLPENSIIALKAGLVGTDGNAPIQDHRKYSYLEFDVQETRDGKLVVFHDKKIKRMLPYKGQNKAVYDELFSNNEFKSRFKRKKIKFKKLRIVHFNLDELKRLRLAGDYDQEVPTLDEFLDTAAKYKLRKPIIVEIKHLHTDSAKRNLLYKVKNFRESYMDHTQIKEERSFDFPETTAFLAFSKKYKKNYGQSRSAKRSWCLELKDLGFKGIFKAGRHSKNFCKKYMK